MNKSRIKKIVERILRKPPEFMLSDILKVAEYFGWEYVECKGSHFKLTKSMRRPIAVSYTHLTLPTKRIV